MFIIITFILVAEMARVPLDVTCALLYYYLFIKYMYISIDSNVIITLAKHI